MLLMPNPASENISVQIDQEMDGNLIIRLVNLMGQQVLERGISKYQKENIDLDISGLPKGVYSLTISNKEQTIANFVVKQ